MKTSSADGIPRPAASIARRHDLDALRAVAMLMGILLHGMLSFIPMPDAGWPVHDVRQSHGYGLILAVIHGFRMPLFFLLSGFFTAMLWRKRGLLALMIHRGKRILLPLVLGTLTIVPLLWVVMIGSSFVAPQSPVQIEHADFWSAVKQGDTTRLEEQLATGVQPNLRHPQSGATALSIASTAGKVDLVTALLDAGAGVNVRDRDGGTPLHAAAFFGRVELASQLIDAGADSTARNRLGETPADITRAGSMRTLVSASLGGIQADPNVIAAGRNQILAMLSASDQAASSTSPAGEVAHAAAPQFNQELGGLVMFLIFFPAFHHLWFLWFLCWMVLAFAGYAWLSDRLSITFPRWLIASPACLLWLIPLTFVPQSMMGLLYPNFGPDTSAGLLPIPQILLYYAIFFFFGALYFDTNDAEGPLGRWWLVMLVLALAVVFPVGYAMTIGQWSWMDRWIDSSWYRPLAVMLEVIYVWLMSFGLMGLFRRCFSGESKTMRYLSDSSYWLYLAHLPLIVVAQVVIRDWQWPGTVKLSLMVSICSLLLLVSYQWFVRYTPVGTLLNGPRRRPEPIVTATIAEPAIGET